MREQQQRIITALERPCSTADQQIDLALSRVYALLIRAADKARAGQQPHEDQQENDER